MKFIDLHLHSVYSDSTNTPQQVVEAAVRQGLHCISLTDHDTVDGIQPIMDAAAPFDLEIIPGIELSSECEGKDIHILGYLFDYKDPDLIHELNDIQDIRITRMEKMIDKLRAFGIDNIEFDEVAALAKSKSLGRPHLAMILEKKGWVKNIYEAFNKYLAEGRPGYVAKFKQTPKQAIQMIKQRGGVAVLAHPMVTQVDDMIPSMVEGGLDGIEVYYPHVKQDRIRHYERIAQQHDLIATGGSDDHGRVKSKIKIGDIKVPYSVVEQMRKRAAACQ